MILIVSSQSDLSTSEVIDWLLYYGVSFVRVSEEDMWTYSSVYIDNESCEERFELNGEEYSFDDFSCIWYRRSFIKLSRKIDVSGVNVFNRGILRHIENELHLVHSFSIGANIDKFIINKFSDNGLNKLMVLYLARKVGLLIPETIVTEKKDDVIQFAGKYGRIITKNISQGVFIYTDEYILNGITNEVTCEMLDTLPDTFSLSLFQRMIPKFVELRIFFIKGQYYATAIFSQEDEQTKIDFRNYNYRKPNRIAPFLLPKEIESKLKILMEEVGLHSGSIDMILTPQDEFVFLEVNPIGLFTQVSAPANFYLEKKIAITLKSVDDGYKNIV